MDVSKSSCEKKVSTFYEKFRKHDRKSYRNCRVTLLRGDHLHVTLVLRSIQIFLLYLFVKSEILMSEEYVHSSCIFLQHKPNNNNIPTRKKKNVSIGFFLFLIYFRNIFFESMRIGTLRCFEGFQCYFVLFPFRKVH